MNGYSVSRGSLLPRGFARALSLAILSAVVLTACGGGGGGGDDDGGSAGGASGGGGGGGTGGGGGGGSGSTNNPPTVDAGADKSGNFPEPVQLQGTASDPESAALTYTWSATGPGSATFEASNALATAARFSAPGTYTLTLSVSDGTNTATDTLQVDIPALYPTATWVTAAPADVGLNATRLDEARTYATSKPRNFANGPSDNGGSGVIVRYGKLAYEWGSRTERYDVKSTTKSIGGIALLLALDDPAANLTLSTTGRSKLDSFGTPPANDDVWRSAVTVEQLATHSGGFEKSDHPLSANNDGALLTEPGTRWRYSDAGLNWLADVLTVTFNQDLNVVLTDRVFQKLGITAQSLTWRTNALRTSTLAGIERRELASGMRVNVDAMARIGYLFLRRGVWGPDRILSESSIDLVQTPRASIANLTIEPDPANFPNATAHYGVLWWTNEDGALQDVPTDAYWAWGLGDSLIVVIPSLDLVIARAGVPDEDGIEETRSWNTEWNGDYSILSGFLLPIVQAATP